MISCPICNRISNYLYTTINNQNIYKCKNCKVLFNYPVSEENKILYENEKYFTETHNLNPSRYNLNTALKTPILNLINYFLKKESDISYLEIGPGNGSLAKAAMNMGWEIHTFDTSSFIIRELNNNGIPADEITNLLNVNFYIKADVIAMSQVIEHIENPHQLFSKLNEIHNSNGILYLSFPNSSSFDRYYHRKNGPDGIFRII